MTHRFDTTVPVDVGGGRDTRRVPETTAVTPTTEAAEHHPAPPRPPHRRRRGRRPRRQAQVKATTSDYQDREEWLVPPTLEG
jgi:hypothetical protein